MSARPHPEPQIEALADAIEALAYTRGHGAELAQESLRYALEAFQESVLVRVASRFAVEHRAQPVVRESAGVEWAQILITRHAGPEAVASMLRDSFDLSWCRRLVRSLVDSDPSPS